MGEFIRSYIKLFSSHHFVQERSRSHKRDAKWKKNFIKNKDREECYPGNSQRITGRINFRNNFPEQYNDKGDADDLQKKSDVRMCSQVKYISNENGCQNNNGDIDKRVSNEKRCQQPFRFCNGFQDELVAFVFRFF